MKEKKLESGVMCISLDTEFFWGVHDTFTIEGYKENIYGGKHIVINGLLDTFKKYGIHATWAVVGAIMAMDKEQVEKYLPNEENRPQYSNPNRSPYHLLETLGRSPEVDDLFFGQDMVRKIQNSEYQEIGTHTFSHYYCCEEGQTVEEFSADIDSAIKLANNLDIQLKSIVFPKNEMSEQHIAACHDKGLKTFRGEEINWIYSLKIEAICKGLRFLDSYFNLSGSNTHIPFLQKEMCNITGSSFLRPYCERLALLEPLKIRRIKKQMLVAAKKKQVFHLWFHPHNFGINFEKNMDNLCEILDYFLVLNKKYNFTSLNMSEITSELFDFK
jgi:hypothetical protein